MRFKRRRCNIVCSFVSVPVVALRIELSTTRLSAVSGPPALDYRSRSGTPESNRPRRMPQTANAAPAPKAGVLPSAPLPVCFQSERPDLNRGHRPARMPVVRSWSPGPQAGTPARCQASPRSVVSGSCGSRTRLDADQRCASVPEGRHPQTDRRTSQIGTRQSRSGSGGARILVSWFSARWTTAARRCPRLSYRPKRKKPGVLVTPGFVKLDRMVRPSVTIADDAGAGYSPVDRQTARRISVRECNSTARPSCSCSPPRSGSKATRRQTSLTVKKDEARRGRFARKFRACTTEDKSLVSRRNIFKSGRKWIMPRRTT